MKKNSTLNQAARKLMAIAVFSFMCAVYTFGQFHFVIYGDTRTYPDQHNTTCGKISTENPQLVIHCGDLWDGYSSSTWKSHITSRSNLNTLLNNNKFLVARGNHEEESAVLAISPSVVKNGSIKYSFRQDNVFFVCMGYDIFANLTWLETELKKPEATSADWRIIYAHTPVYSTGSHGASGNATLERICDTYNVVATFSGHDHLQSRTKPMYNRAVVSTSNDIPATTKATAYYVTGTGAIKASVGSATWQAFGSTSYAYQVIDAYSDRIVIKTKTTTGSILDTYTKRRTPPGPASIPYTDSDKTVTKSSLNWSSGLINISTASSVQISMDLEGLNATTLEPDDYCNVYYKVNGGTQQTLSLNTGAFAKKTVSVSGISGSTVEVIIQALNSATDETYKISAISVKASTVIVPETGVTVSPTSATLNVNATQQLTATVLPTNATNKSVTWSTSNSTIASVSITGLVTARAVGSATITVRTNDGGKTATSAITVTPTTTPTYFAVCDALSENGTWQTNTGNTISVTSSDIKQGTGALKCVGSLSNEFKRANSPVFNSGLTEATAALKFWYYCSDVTKSSSRHVELGSGGVNDVNEYDWLLTTTLAPLVNGWNLIDVKVTSATKVGTPNLASLNWFRFYATKSATLTTKVDAIQVLAATASSKSAPAFVENTEKGFTMYPNPLSSESMLTIQANGKGSSIVKIYDMSGRMVYLKALDASNSLNLFANDILKRGLYNVSIISNDAVVSKQLIVK